MSRNDAKQLTEQFQAVLLKLQTAVAEIEEQINIALAARDERIQALEDRIAALEAIS
jgi:BMFP domain-containing protein YqiC